MVIYVCHIAQNIGRWGGHQGWYVLSSGLKHVVHSLQHGSQGGRGGVEGFVA